jgi:hypothetical protein
MLAVHFKIFILHFTYMFFKIVCEPEDGLA